MVLVLTLYFQNYWEFHTDILNFFGNLSFKSGKCVDFVKGLYKDRKLEIAVTNSKIFIIIIVHLNPN